MLRSIPPKKGKKRLGSRLYSTPPSRPLLTDAHFIFVVQLSRSIHTKQSYYSLISCHWLLGTHANFLSVASRFCGMHYLTCNFANTSGPPVYAKHLFFTYFKFLHFLDFLFELDCCALLTRMTAGLPVINSTTMKYLIFDIHKML